MYFINYIVHVGQSAASRGGVGQPQNINCIFASRALLLHSIVSHQHLHWPRMMCPDKNTNVHLVLDIKRGGRFRYIVQLFAASIDQRSTTGHNTTPSSCSSSTSITSGLLRLSVALFAPHSTLPPFECSFQRIFYTLPLNYLDKDKWRVPRVLCCAAARGYLSADICALSVSLYPSTLDSIQH